MKRRTLSQRPSAFRLDNGHPLANGLVLAGLGGSPGSTLYRDSSSLGNHGTLSDMDPTIDWTWVPQIGRFALDFDGSNDYVTLPTTIVGMSTVHTVSLWAKCTNFTQYAILVSSVHNEIIYIYGGTSEIGCSWGEPNGNLTASGNLTAGKWHHWCVLRNGGTSGLRFFLDGVEKTLTTTSNFSANGNYLGQRTGVESHRYFSGSLSDVLVINRLISTAEISVLADPSNVMLSGLIVPPRRKLFTGGAAAPPAALEATIAQTLPALTQSVTTDLDASSSIAQSLPNLTQVANADATITPAPPVVVGTVTNYHDSIRFLTTDLTSLSVSVGDILLLILAQDSTVSPTLSSPSDTYTQLFSAATAASRLSAWYVQVTSNTTVSHITAGTANFESYAAVVYQIRHAVAVESGTAATGTDAYPDAPALNPSGWDVDMSLWLAAAGWDGNVSLVEYPTGQNQQTARSATTGGCGVAASMVVESVASYDPSLFALSGAEDWAANTIVLRGGSPVTIAQTLPKLTQAGQADADVSASIGQTLPKLTQSVSVSQSASCSIGQTLPKLTQAVTTDADVATSIGQTLPTLTQSVATDADVSSSIAQILPILTQAAEANQGSTCSIAQTLPLIMMRDESYITHGFDATNITFEGYFGLIKNQGSETYQRMGLGSLSAASEDGNLWIGGHVYLNSIMAFDMPLTSLTTSKVYTTFTSATVAQDWHNQDPTVLAYYTQPTFNGLDRYDSTHLVAVNKTYYEVSGDRGAPTIHLYSKTGGTYYGPWYLEGENENSTGGNVCEIPPILRHRFGGKSHGAACAFSAGNASCTWGPGLITFTPDKAVAASGDLPSRRALFYPIANRMPTDSEDGTMNAASHQAGIGFVRDGDTFYLACGFIVGLGAVHYKGTDPHGTEQGGYWSDWYRSVIYLYSIDDLQSVYDETVDSWEIMPVKTIDVDSRLINYGPYRHPSWKLCTDNYQLLVVEGGVMLNISTYEPPPAVHVYDFPTSDNRLSVIWQTLPKLTQAAEVTHQAAGDCSIAQTLPKLTQAVTCDVDGSAAIGQTLPKLTQSVSCDLDGSVSIAQTLPSLTQSVTASQTTGAVINQTLPRLGQAITAAVICAAEINQELPSLTQSAQSQVIAVELDCSIAQTLPRLTQRVLIGEPAYSAARSFRVPTRNSTFTVQARLSTFTVQP